MHTITVDSAAASSLAAAASDVEVWDGDGQTLGLFVPEARALASPDWVEDRPQDRAHVRGVAAEKLRAAETEVKVRDPAGRLLGHFLPYPPDTRKVCGWKPAGGGGGRRVRGPRLRLRPGLSAPTPEFHRCPEQLPGGVRPHDPTDHALARRWAVVAIGDSRRPLSRSTSLTSSLRKTRDGRLAGRRWRNRF